MSIAELFNGTESSSVDKLSRTVHRMISEVTGKEDLEGV
jgi:hypothetical protein